jgi:ubiquinone/menaquinone biosynthesis C-methylase UbiE
MNDNEQIKETVKEQFRKKAEKYVTSETHAKGDDLSLMLDWLNPQADWNVLDIATGGGHVSKQLSPYVRHIFSTDLTREMLATAQKHLAPYCNNVWFMVADAENLPFLDGTFDIVTCRIAAHHFPNPQNFICEAGRVLKPGGKLLLIDNIVPDDERVDEFVNKLEKYRDRSHVRCYRVNDWTDWAQDADLEIEQSRLRKKTFDFPTWVRRTTESENQVEQVCQHILQADKALQEYCGLLLNDGEISSINIDEWMVLFMKKQF